MRIDLKSIFHSQDKGEVEQIKLELCVLFFPNSLYQRKLL